MPAVSVVISTRNRPDLLKSAIESVLAQDFTDFELIVVDDGSTDNTYEVVSKVQDKRMSYVYQQNAGRCVARNRGLELAVGRYIAFLDDDDLYLPHKIGFQASYLDEHPDVDLIGSSARLVDLEGHPRGVWRAAAAASKLFPGPCVVACPVMPSTAMFRKSALAKLDQWFDVQFEVAEDKDFFTRIVLAGCRAVLVPDVLTLYRIHGANSHSDGRKMGSSMLRCLDKWFTSNAIPPELRPRRSELYAEYYVSASLYSYATGYIREAQSDLEEALSLYPPLVHGSPRPPVVERIAGFAHTYNVANPIAFLDLVFKNLPASVAYLDRYRRAAKSAFYMERFFVAKEVGMRPSLKDWTLGNWYDQSWLLNRGAWSILVKKVIGQGTSREMHSLFNNA